MTGPWGLARMPGRFWSEYMKQAGYATYMTGKWHLKADNTYIFFTADHGLANGHHGLLGKQNMYDHSVRVPFMVNGPGVPQGKQIAAPIYLQDVMPTTLELAGIDQPDHVQFKSLLPMITLGDHKLILYPKIKKVRLYNLQQDPWEMSDLADAPASKSIIKKLFAKLLKLQQEIGDELDLKSVYPDL